MDIFVDGDPITDGSTGPAVGGTARLTPGVHAIRVQAEAGEFFIRSITVARRGNSTASAPIVGSTASSALPAGWQSDDVGAPALAGNARVDNGTWIVTGAGQNIWGAADEFQFAHTSVNGDATLIARVDSIDDTHAWAKAGLMFRADAGESAPFAAVYKTPENGVMFEWRSYYRGAAIRERQRARWAGVGETRSPRQFVRGLLLSRRPIVDAHWQSANDRHARRDPGRSCCDFSRRITADDGTVHVRRSCLIVAR